MKYRVTCLSPTLVGDGNKLSPIDYMVWKDQVNVLDQRRILKMLSKGPRFDSYLAQLKRADKLDFASWGGFAQNFAGRRIPFEDPSVVAAWERAQLQHLFIPTFAASAAGAYLPATAIKGALRTGSVFDRWSPAAMKDLAGKLGAEESNVRLPRYLAAKSEEAVLGAGGKSRMRKVSAGDSAVVPHTGMKVYLVRTSTLIPKGGNYELGWKPAPAFAEMAVAGTKFEGSWSEDTEQDRGKMFQASNRYAVSQIERHKEYAKWTGLAPLAASLDAIEARIKSLEGRQDACILSLGWGGGMLSKVAAGDTGDPAYRSIIRHVSLYQGAVKSGLPFPKTRRIIHETGKPAQLPGWVLLEVI